MGVRHRGALRPQSLWKIHAVTKLIICRAADCFLMGRVRLLRVEAPLRWPYRSLTLPLPSRVVVGLQHLYDLHETALVDIGLGNRMCRAGEEDC